MAILTTLLLPVFMASAQLTCLQRSGIGFASCSGRVVPWRHFVEAVDPENENPPAPGSPAFGLFPVQRAASRYIRKFREAAQIAEAAIETNRRRTRIDAIATRKPLRRLVLESCGERPEFVQADRKMGKSDRLRLSPPSRGQMTKPAAGRTSYRWRAPAWPNGTGSSAMARRRPGGRARACPGSAW